MRLQDVEILVFSWGWVPWALGPPPLEVKEKVEFF